MCAFVEVCVCLCACKCACLCVLMCVCVCVGVNLSVCAGNLCCLLPLEFSCNCLIVQVEFVSV